MGVEVEVGRQYFTARSVRMLFGDISLCCVSLNICFSYRVYFFPIKIKGVGVGGRGFKLTIYWL